MIKDLCNKSSLFLHKRKMYPRKRLQKYGVMGCVNSMLSFCCKVLVLILPFTHNAVKRGESIIAQSGAATSHGVASERSETRSRERRNSGYKSQKELESDEA